MNYTTNTVLDFEESWKECLKIMKEDYVLQGDFILSSGQRVTHYVDVKSATTEYHFMTHALFLLDGFCQAFLEPALNDVLQNSKLKKQKLILVGLESGALPLLTGLQMKYFWSIAWVRKKDRDHGLDNSLVGYLDDEDRVVIIEDVLNTGAGINRVANVVGIDRIIGVVCVANRSNLGDRLNLTDAKTFKSRAVDVRSMFEMKHLIGK